MATKDITDVLVEDRNYHLDHVQSLNKRISFVAMTFAGFLLVQAWSINAKRQELYKPDASAISKAMLKKIGELQPKMAEPLTAMSQGQLSEEELGLMVSKFSAKIAKATLKELEIALKNSVLIPAEASHYVAFLAAGFGMMFLLLGLIMHTSQHTRMVIKIESALANHLALEFPDPSSEETGSDNNARKYRLGALINREPDKRRGIMHHDASLFVGIGLVTIGSLILAIYILFCVHSAFWIAIWLIGPTTLLTIIHLVIGTFKTAPVQ